MKQNIKLILLIIVATITGNTLMAQKGVQFSVQYNIATPLNTEFKDYISTTSTRGGQASILYGFNNYLKVGVQGSFNNFYQKYDRQVYKTTDGADISAVLSNTLQTIPVLVKGEYSFLKSNFIKPYVGLGAGVGFINFEQYIGEFEYSRNYTKAVFLGDIGVLIPFKKNSNYGFKVSTSYNLLLFDEENINRLESWNVQAGISIPLR